MSSLLQKPKVPPSLRRLPAPILLSKKSNSVVASNNKSKKEEVFEKPVVTTMGKMFPAVDKVCDATWMKKIFGMTSKKNALLFIADTAPVHNFFTQMEHRMAENRTLIKQEIESFIGQLDIQRMISGFKVSLKQKEAEQKLLKKEAERLAIVEQNRELVVEQERHRVIAEYLETEAKRARELGDEKTAEENFAKAQAARKLQQEMEARMEQKTTESSDSSVDDEEDQEVTELEEESEAVQPKPKPKTTPTTTQATTTAPIESTASPASPTSSSTTSNSPQTSSDLSISRIKELIEITNNEGFLLVTQGTKEFKITSLHIDAEKRKLVINIDSVSKISF